MSQQHPLKPMHAPDQHPSVCYICAQHATQTCYRCHKLICPAHARHHELFYSETPQTFCVRCEQITADMLAPE